MPDVLPKISIVTPSYNQGEFLEQTILSVLDQNYPNLEYIVIDGGSTDNSVGIIKKYERHLSYWISEKDKGQSDAINKGIRKMTGDIFNWLNSDDFFSPGILKEVARTYKSNPDVVCGRIRFHYPDGRTAISSDFPHSKDIVEVIASTKYVQQSTFFPLGFIREIGGVNPELHYAMDFEIWIKYLFKHGLSSVKNNENVIADFRIHNASKTYLSDNNFFYEWIKIFASVLSFYDKKIEEKYFKLLGTYRFRIDKIVLDEGVVRKAISFFYYDALVFLYGQRNFELFDTIFHLLEIKYLGQEKIDELHKMKLRRKFIPSWFFRLREKGK